MPVYDYIIIGSGIAGLYTALLAQEHGRVLILTKGSIDECNTKLAQGGIAAAIPPWAYLVLHSSMLPLVSSSTRPCSWASSAVYSPAMPEPMMM